MRQRGAIPAPLLLAPPAGLALRVDPANAPAVSFYRKAGFTTVATVVSKKSGKLRLLMSREIW